MRLKKPMFNSRACCGARPHLDLHPGGAQPRKALARHLGVGVGNAGHHAPYARLYQRIAARPRAPLVRAGFQRHIGRGAAHVMAAGGGIAQRHYLGMRAAGLLGKTLAKHGAVAAGDHAAHARIRVGKTKRLGCEPKRLLDEGCGACHDAAMVARRTMRLCKPRRPVNSCRVRK